VDLADVKGILAESYVDPDRVGIGEEKPDALCVLDTGSGYAVVLCEGSTRVEEHEFSTQNDACVYFLLRALRRFVHS
jgi:hypothetical protein